MLHLKIRWFDPFKSYFITKLYNFIKCEIGDHSCVPIAFKVGGSAVIKFRDSGD